MQHILGSIVCYSYQYDLVANCLNYKSTSLAKFDIGFSRDLADLNTHISMQLEPLVRWTAANIKSAYARSMEMSTVARIQPTPAFHPKWNALKVADAVRTRNPPFMPCHDLLA